MLTDSYRKPNSFDFDFFLVLFLGLDKFVLLISEFVKIDKLGYWWYGLGRDFYQIHALLPRRGQSLGNRHYSYLFSSGVNHSYFRNLNTLVNASERCLLECRSSKKSFPHCWLSE